jgi:hypothetical protein
MEHYNSVLEITFLFLGIHNLHWILTGPSFAVHECDRIWHVLLNMNTPVVHCHKTRLISEEYCTYRGV